MTCSNSFGSLRYALAPRGSHSAASGPADQVFDSGVDYVSDFAGTDECRCFLIDSAVANLIDAIAVSISATNRSRVHHVFVEMPKGAYFVVDVHYNFLANRNANRMDVQVWSAKQPITALSKLRTSRLGAKNQPTRCVWGG